MRRVSGWLLAVLGLLLIVVGVACAAVVGSDSALTSGPHRLESKGSVVVTGDDALDHVGPTLRLSVTAPDGGKVFIGLASAVDVRDYLRGSPVTRVDSVSWPWKATTTQVPGKAAPAVEPSELDWWLVSDEGDGSASIDFPLPNQVVDVVVMDPDRGDGFVVDVTAAVEIPGLFAGGLAVAAFGLGLVLAAALMLRRRRAVDADGDDDGAEGDTEGGEASDQDEPGGEAESAAAPTDVGSGPS